MQGLMGIENKITRDQIGICTNFNSEINLVSCLCFCMKEPMFFCKGLLFSNISNTCEQECMCMRDFVSFIVFKSKYFCELLESGIVFQHKFSRFVFHVKVFE
jgi:hypothetical protein